jgi:hypothetical protein
MVNNFTVRGNFLVGKILLKHSQEEHETYSSVLTTF